MTLEKVKEYLEEIVGETPLASHLAKEALAKLSTFIESNGWQDISEVDSKYKDTEIIGCIEYAEGKFGEPFSCFYNHEEERFQSCRITELMPHIPTHFTPLPAIKSIKQV